MAVLAIDIGGTKIAAAFVTRRGDLRHRLEEPTDASAPLAPVEQIAAIAGRLPRVDALGIAVPGLVRRDGTVWAPNVPGWTRLPLARLLRRRVRVPVFVESDRNAAVLGEVWRGVARGQSDVVVVIVGTGIGAGILSGGHLVRGARELSGCAGWMVVTPETNADTARCGSLEALAAGPAVARASGAADAREAARRARGGNRRARRAFEDAGERLGLAVANIISLFDPATIVLTGGVTAAAPLFMRTLRRHARARAQPLSARHVKIVVSRLGADANLLGVGRLAWASGETR